MELQLCEHDMGANAIQFLPSDIATLATGQGCSTCVQGYTYATRSATTGKAAVTMIVSGT